MPKKPSSWGQQEYVPAGNGDASGEYADEGGSNIHYFSKFKKPEGEVKTLTKEEKFKQFTDNALLQEAIKDSKKKPKFADIEMDLEPEKVFDDLELDLEEMQDLSKEIQEPPSVEEDLEEIKIQIEEPKKTSSTVEEFISQTQKDFKEIGGEEVKKILETKYAEELDVEKVKTLTDNQAIKLAVAMNVLDGKDKLFKSLNEDKNAFFEKIYKNPLINANQVWKAFPNTPQAFDESVDKKITYLQDLADKYEQIQESGEDASYKNLLGKIEALKQLKESPELQAWREEEKALEEATGYDFSKYQKLVNKYENKNNVYSQKAKDEAKWFKSSVSSSKTFSPYADKIIKEWNEKDPHAIQMIKDYTGSFSSINNPLRNLVYPHKSTFPEQSKQKQKQFIDHVEGITKVLDSSTYDFNCWVQRGVGQLNLGNKMLNYSASQDELNNLVGTKFEDQGFLSCGSHKGGGFSSNSIIMNIYCPKGTKMLYVKDISAYKSEDETIIQRGYTYKITKVEKANGRIYLDCEVQLGTDINKYNSKKLEELKEKHF